MTKNVVILAQGTQARLPDLLLPKQLLKLPSCNNVAIIDRTIRQVVQLSDESEIIVVGWPEFVDHFATSQFATSRDVTVVTLEDPGNSSLKGLYRYLMGHGSAPNDRVVLLGDVIYSWACMRELLADCTVKFVGSSNLSRGGGELWGVSWSKHQDGTMFVMLEEAMKKHPPAQVDNTYQAGQMRRLLWEVDGRWGDLDQRKLRWWFVPCDDYTFDIDIPEHVKRLTDLSDLASYDDRHIGGITW